MSDISQILFIRQCGFYLAELITQKIFSTSRSRLSIKNNCTQVPHGRILLLLLIIISKDTFIDSPLSVLTRFSWMKGVVS